MHLITAQRDQILLLMKVSKTYSAVWRSVELVYELRCPVYDNMTMFVRISIMFV